jgi:hypothetical protein
MDLIVRGKVRRLIKICNLIGCAQEKIGQKRSGIAPLNHLPLLPSGPGGFSRSWSCRRYKSKEKINVYNNLIQQCSF